MPTASSLIAPEQHDAIVRVREAADEPNFGVLHLRLPGLIPQLTYGFDDMLDAEQIAVCQ
jgi:hypothetical protein